MHKISPIIFTLFFTINTAYSAESGDIASIIGQSLKIMQEHEAKRKVEEKRFNKELKTAEWQAHVAGFKTATITTAGMVAMTGGLTALTSPSPTHNILGGIVSSAAFCTTAYYLNGQKIQRKYLADLKKSALEKNSKRIVKDSFRFNARQSNMSYSGTYTTLLSCCFAKSNSFSPILMGTFLATSLVKCVSFISTLKAENDRKKEKTAVKNQKKAAHTAVPGMFKPMRLRNREYHEKMVI